MDNLYAKELSKQSIARACAALGIKHIRSECVDALADIVRNHIRMIAISSRENAEQSGRAYAGIQDIIRALESPSAISMNWKDLKAFAFSPDSNFNIDEDGSLGWNQPFLFDVPSFPIDTSDGDLRDDAVNEILPSSMKDSFIPSHLPAYPHSHTYKKCGGHNKRHHEGEHHKDKRPRQSTLKSAKESLTKIEEVTDDVLPTNS